MISQQTVDTVRQLLSEGELSQRAIARRVGLSRATVNRIATGTRQPKAPAKGQRPQGVCPKCRCNVLLPCLACSLRAPTRSEIPVARPVGLGEPTLKLELEQEHQQRYRDIAGQQADPPTDFGPGEYDLPAYDESPADELPRHHDYKPCGGDED